MMNTQVTTSRDFDVINKSLLQFLGSSYKTLYDSQRDYIRKMQFHISDLRPLLDIPGITKPFVTEYYLQIPLTVIDYNNRINYRKSPIYRKRVSISDLSNDDLVHFNLLFFLEGLMLREHMASAYIDDGTLYLIFDIVNNRDVIDINRPNDVIDIIITKQHFMATGVINRRDIVDNCISVDVEGFTQHGELPKPNPQFQYMTFMTSVTNNGGMTYIPTKNVTENQVVLDSMGGIGLSMNAQIIYVPGAIENIIIEPGTNYFELPIMNAPIIKENFIIFKLDRKLGAYRLVNNDDVTIESFYPNIYKVNNKNNDRLVIVPMYDFIELVEYKNYSKIYYSLFNDIVKQYEEADIDNMVKEYKPYEFIFNPDNFLEDGQWLDKYKYHFDVLRNAVLYNEEYLIKYMGELIRPSGMLGSIKMIKLNLNDRIRTTTELELPNKVIKFKDPHYVFEFKVDSHEEAKSIKWFLDGLLYTPEHFYGTDNRYYYLYLPIDKIHKHSVLDIDKCIDYHHEEVVDFSRTKPYIIHKLNHTRSFVRLYDVFLVDTQTNNPISRESYSVSLKDETGNWIRTSNLSKEINDVIMVTVHDDEYLVAGRAKLVISQSSLVRQMKVSSAMDEVFISPNDDNVNYHKIEEDNRNYIVPESSLVWLHKPVDEIQISKDLKVVDEIKYIEGQYLLLHYDCKISVPAYTILEDIKAYIEITVHYKDKSKYVWDNVVAEEVNKFSHIEMKIRPKWGNPIEKITARIVVTGNEADAVNVIFKNIKLERGWRPSDFSGAHEGYVLNRNLLPDSDFVFRPEFSRGIVFNKSVRYMDTPTIQPMIAFNDHIWTSDKFIISSNKELLIHFHAMGVKERPNYENIGLRVEFFNIHGDNIHTYEHEWSTPSILKMITWNHIISDKIGVPNTALHCRVSIIMDTMVDDLFISRPVVEESLYDHNYTLSSEDSTMFKIPYGTVENIGQYVRIFINGKKVPSHLNFIKKCIGDYKRKASGEMYEPFYIINTLAKREVGDLVTLDISNIRCRRVAYFDKINITGYIDLRGHIKKPFNLRWHEVYLNGYRLNSEMIEVLSSAKIQLKHSLFGDKETIPSMYSLEIFERELNDDDTAIMGTEDDYQNILADNYLRHMFSVRITETEENIYNPLSEFVYRDKDLEFGIWFDRQVYRYFNPNFNQIEAFDLLLHPTLCDIETGTKLMIIPNIPFDVRFVNYINPNEGGFANEREDQLTGC